MGDYESDELSEEKTKELKNLLVALKGSLSQVLESSVDSVRVVELDQPIGRLSRMDAIQQQKMATANRAAHKRRLSLVRGALSRIGDGDYGFCSRCEEPIAFRRLQAKPETLLCLSCQKAKEQR